ncbi:hypothetical protein CR161_08380 [Prosthecochloris sp. ZM]|nr:hypothetical protein CR161_08380 [Prosthecochloris sp. ZM]
MGAAGVYPPAAPFAFLCSQFLKRVWIFTSIAMFFIDEEGVYIERKFGPFCLSRLVGRLIKCFYNNKIRAFGPFLSYIFTIRSYNDTTTIYKEIPL